MVNRAAPHPSLDLHELCRAQLAAILGSPQFRNSRRYPLLLERIVEHTLAGDLDLLKERLLGVEVFKRTPGYDTTADPVVRVTAGEIRRRLAQFYQNHPEAELLISLPIGSYIADLRPLHPAPATEHPPAEAMQQPEDSSPADPLLPKPVSHRRDFPATPRWRLTATLAAMALGLGVLAGPHLADLGAILHPSALRQFWKPLLAPASPVLVVVGNVASTDPVLPTADLSLLDSLRRVDVLAFADAVAMQQVVAHLDAAHVANRVQISTRTDIAQLRAGPLLLVGGLDNAWTMKLGAALRYRLVNGPQITTGSVVDTRDPARHWDVDFRLPADAQHADYALVVRNHDTVLDQDVLILAGISAAGTLAAAEFVTSDRYLAELERNLPKGWQSRNLEVLLSTEVDHGAPTRPVILDTVLW